jgi:hypothetical protein
MVFSVSSIPTRASISSPKVRCHSHIFSSLTAPCPSADAKTATAQPLSKHLQCISIQCTMNCEALYEEIRLPHISDDPSGHRLCDRAVNPTASSTTVDGHNFNNHHQRRPSASQEEHDNYLFWHHLDRRLSVNNNRTTCRFHLHNQHHQQSEWGNLVSNHHNHSNTPSAPAGPSSSTLKAEGVSLREG